MNDPIVGIDLGTSNSVVACADEAGIVEVLADEKGNKIQPSVVSFHPNGSVAVGAVAKQRRVIDPKNTVYSAKRLIGRTFKAKEVAQTAARTPYEIKEGVNEQPVIVTRAGEFAIPEISAIVLDHMRTIARRALNQEVARAVITVPANFTEAQRSATATAGAIAGLTVVRVLSEPTAAALAYGNLKKTSEIITVYDFGGGTFDCTILQLHDDVYQVLGTAGDTFLGGDDIDERLVDLMVQSFLQTARSDLRGDELAMQRLRVVAEQTKIELSRRTKAVIRIDEIAYGPGGAPINLNVEVTRDELITRATDLVDRTFKVCAEALRVASLTPVAVAEIVLVGGTTKMPFVRDRVAQFFGKTPRTDVNPDEAVAVGAALQGAAMARVLGAVGPRTTARAGSVAPPAPPMEKVSGPPPLPAGVAARRTTAPPRETARRVASTRERDAQAPTQVELGAPAGELPEIDLGEVRLEETEDPTGIRDSSRRNPTPIVPRERSTQPQFAVPGGRPPPHTTQPMPAVPMRPQEYPTVVPRIGRDALDLDIETDVGTLPGASAAGAKTLLGMQHDSALGDDLVTNPGPPARAAHGSSPPVAPAASWAPSPAVSVLPPAAPTLAPHAQHTYQAPQAPPARQAPPVQMPQAPQAPPRAPVIIDVLPHALGVGTIAGYCEEVIQRNRRVPAEQTRVFATSKDLQDTVLIRVCQGNSRRIGENTVLGDLTLEGLEPRPRGQVKVEVTFQIDASGILHVRARDPQTGAERRASLNTLGAQSPAQVAAAQERLQNLRR